ncbi:MAG: serine hydrolase domain-containing protein [Christensenellales bacterium]|jgi:CubicO group peptidase (beta-lactamase class C family)
MVWEAMRAYQEALLDSCAMGTDLAVYQGETPLYRHMNGFANREAGVKVTADTIFRVFSMTKPIICAVALMLHDQGRFLMTEPVGKYLPAFEQMWVKDGDDVREAEKPIRILDLFTMTSGLSYELDRDSLRAAQKAHGFDLTMAQAAEAIAWDPLEFEPGTRFCYGLSHDVLGVLIERLCGASLGECLEEMLFRPLGMSRSFFTVPDALRPSCAQCYSSRPPFGREEEMERLFSAFPRMESGGGGLWMTMDDYLRFQRMMLREGMDEKGRPILSRAAVRLMRINHLAPGALTTYMQERPGYGYGLGVRVLMAPEAIGALSLPGEYGWAGTQGTWMMIDPERNVAAAFMMQGEPGPNRQVHPRLRNLVSAAVSCL